MLSRTRWLEATDRKDFVYGLLGITRLGILPACNDSKTLAEVLCDFVEAWLKLQ
jgi:hypothetical protein